MKKGFTLIELLAVIVILAIIALIATPIILGIINDARKESNERSAELYASAVRNAIASYQLTHPNAPTKFIDLNVQYDGNVECATEELYADGSFYIAECTVNGTEVEYTYGTKQVTQVYKPQYYWFNLNKGSNIGEDLPSDAKTSASEIDTLGFPFYLGLDVDSSNKVTAAYACLTRNETEYCLKGANDDSTYEKNIEIIKDAFKDVVDTDSCSFETNRSYCSADGVLAFIDSNGVSTDDDEDYNYCAANFDGYFECWY